MRISARALLAAATAASFAVLAAGCGGDDNAGGNGGGPIDQVITVNWGAEPPSLDPGLATDTTSSNVLLNIMDPLVKLGRRPRTGSRTSRRAGTRATGRRSPSTSARTEVDERGPCHGERLRVLVEADDLAGAGGGLRLPVLRHRRRGGVQRLRRRLRGARRRGRRLGPRRLHPRGDADLAAALVRPAGRRTTRSWPCNQSTVEQFGDKWTEAGEHRHERPVPAHRVEARRELDLAKWDEWRDAASVALTASNSRIISDGHDALQAFEAGEVDAWTAAAAARGDPAAEGDARVRAVPGARHLLLRLQRQERRRREPAPRDVARDRPAGDHRQHRAGRPASGDGLHAAGHARVRRDQRGDSPWLPPTATSSRRRADGQGREADKITLFFNDSPGHQEIATAVQAEWKQLGIDVEMKQQEWAQFLEFLGPPPNEAVDVYRLGWIGDYVDAINFLELWTCKSGNNNTNWCNKEFDDLIDQARETPDDAARYDLYAQAEALLTGADGELPVMPIYWYTYTNLERGCIQDTFNINLLDQFDLSKVVVEGECS